MADHHAEWCTSPKPTHRAPPKMSGEELQRRIRGHKMFLDATASQAHKQQKERERLEEVDAKIRSVVLPDETRAAAQYATGDRSSDPMHSLRLWLMSRLRSLVRAATACMMPRCS